MISLTRLVDPTSNHPSTSSSTSSTQGLSTLSPPPSAKEGWRAQQSSASRTFPLACHRTSVRARWVPYCLVETPYKYRAHVVAWARGPQSEHSTVLVPRVCVCPRASPALCRGSPEPPRCPTFPVPLCMRGRGATGTPSLLPFIRLVCATVPSSGTQDGVRLSPPVHSTSDVCHGQNPLTGAHCLTLAPVGVGLLAHKNLRSGQRHCDKRVSADRAGDDGGAELWPRPGRLPEHRADQVRMCACISACILVRI